MRHTPTLYSHPERDQHGDEDEEYDVDAEDEEIHNWGVQPQRSFSSPPTVTSSSNSGRTSRTTKFRSSSILNPPQTPTSKIPKYPDIYSQFVRRYRSTEPGEPDDPRNDPDNHYFQRGLGQLVDAGDSDDEDGAARITLAGAVTLDRTLTLDSQPIQPASQEERERLEWQTMLASVLAGDVLKSEKTRIAVALESLGDEQNNLHLNIWLGIRAKFHGRTVEEERIKLEEKRLRVVDAALNDVMQFRIKTNEGETAKEVMNSAVKQVVGILHLLETVQSLYPNLKAFYLDKPAAAEGHFQARCDTLNTWCNVLFSLKHHFAVLRRWTGSDTLDVNQPNTSSEVPIGTLHHSRRNSIGSTPDLTDGTSFVERLLKEESMQRTFEKGSLVTVNAFIGAARDAQVNLAPFFRAMNLPSFEHELVPLISFPTNLAQAGLRLRLNYVQNLEDPEVLIIDQMTEDLKISIGLACTLKRQYERFLRPDPGRHWNLPQCISEDYDSTILEALTCFFRLIHWKLKSGAKGIYFKETDVLEAQGPTFDDVSRSASGGSRLVAEQLW